MKRCAFGTQIALYMADSNKDPRRAVAMFRLDYLSCFLTVVATILVGRKMWTGLVVSGVNSLIVCVIGLHTSQYGFIPANVFCICINAFNLRAWLKVQKDLSESTTDASSELVVGLIKSCRIRSEGRLGNSISSLDVKGVSPFAPTPAPTNTNVGVIHPWRSFIAASRFRSYDGQTGKNPIREGLPTIDPEPKKKAQLSRLHSNL